MDYRCACPAGHYGDQCEFKGKINIRFYLLYILIYIQKLNHKNNWNLNFLYDLEKKINNKMKDLRAHRSNRVLVDLENSQANSLNRCIFHSVKCFNDGECIQISELNSLGFKCLCKANFSGFFCETSNYQK